MKISPNVLTKDFFKGKNTLCIAENILGKVLVRRYRGRIGVYLLTEVEAYDGPHDKASHAHHGKTPRNAQMFGEAGKWYVYFVYGMHWMLNIVTGPKEYPAAILIRGVALIQEAKTRTIFACAEHKVAPPARGASRSRLVTPPLAGTMLTRLRKALSIEHRASFSEIAARLNKLNGPGRLTSALKIDEKFNGKRASKKTGLWIEDWGIKIPPRAIRRVPRIGVSYAKEWAKKPYRYLISSGNS